MSYTKTVYQADDQTWSWAVLDPNQQPIIQGGGYAHVNAAEIAAARELCVQRVLAGELRSDGEPMTGIDALDNDRSLPLDTSH
ncbi:hypothetical protein DWU98_14655 [Dyella monticola]|uniref:DUF2188 domain-containing protein n=1 Tax=Dyella monticola TaxID=1927958 RepID=A0A370WVN5_9GAMM|nr:hypothetical protein [Dyella monticola]RDS80150.1 hypothetical protein DWU98_14655 [Dyella monticola]